MIDTTLPVRLGERFAREHRFTPGQVRAFSLTAGDDNPLHMDAAKAAVSPYGALIVSGTHTSALLLGLTASHFSKRTTVVGRTFTVTFRRAVRADATVSIEWEVVGVTPRAGKTGAVVALQGTLRNMLDGEICVAASGEVVVGL